LYAGKQSTAVESLRSLVEAAVNHVGVEEAVQLRPQTEEQSLLRQRAPDASVEPIATRATMRRSDEGHSVELVDIELVAETARSRHGLSRASALRLWGVVAVEPPTKAEARRTTADEVA